MSEYRQHPGPAPSGRPAQQRVPRAPRPTCGQGRNRAPSRPPPRSMPPTAPLSLSQRRSAGGGGYPYRQQPTYQQPGSGRPRKKSGPWRVVFWIALVVFVVALAALGAIGFSYWQGQQTYNDVAREGFTPPDDLSATSLADFTVDWDALKDHQSRHGGVDLHSRHRGELPHRAKRPTTRSTLRTTSRDRKAGSPRSAPSSWRPRTAPTSPTRTTSSTAII